MEVLFQCPACKRLVAVNSARAAELQVYLRCVECGEEAALDLDGEERLAVKKAELAAALEPEPTEEPQVASAEAFLEDHPELAELRAALDEVEVPAGGESIAVGFDRLLTRWDDAAEHKKLIKAATASGELAQLGQRYRVVLEARPGDARATDAQQKIIGAAMATMTPGSFTMKGTRERGGAGLVILAVTGLAVVGGLLFFWMRYRGGI